MRTHDPVSPHDDDLPPTYQAPRIVDLGRTVNKMRGAFQLVVYDFQTMNHSTFQGGSF